jgi:hypothetical protein
MTQAHSLLTSRAETAANEPESNQQIWSDELGVEIQHAKAKRPNPRIPPSISAEPLSVIRPIGLDDEAAGRREEVDDVLAQRDLPPERDPELSPGQLSRVNRARCASGDAAGGVVTLTSQAW